MNICMMSLMLENYSPEIIVDTAVECGMKAIDWITTHNTDPVILKKLSDDRDLKIAAHTPLMRNFIEGRPGEMDEFKLSLENAVVLGAPVLMIPPFPRMVQTSMAEDRKAWIGYYSQMVEPAAAAGITIAIESTGFINSPIVTGEELKEVLDQLPQLRVAFDNGNAATACDPVAAYKLVQGKVVHFHLKDWKISDRMFPGADLKRDGRYFADTILGSGDNHVAEFWQALIPADKKLTVNLETADLSGKLSPVELQKLVASRVGNW